MRCTIVQLGSLIITGPSKRFLRFPMDFSRDLLTAVVGFPLFFMLLSIKIFFARVSCHVDAITAVNSPSMVPFSVPRFTTALKKLPLSPGA